MIKIKFDFMSDCFKIFGRHAYASIIQLDNMGFLYYRQDHGKNEKIVYRTTRDGLNFSAPKKPVIDVDNKIRISHNFSPFFDKKDNNFKAIAGRYGLNFYSSVNGINWNFINTRKLNTVKAELILKSNKFKLKGHIKRYKHYDAFSSCVFDKKCNKYKLYHRLNLKKGARYIQYFESKDFINWDNGRYFHIINNDYVFKKDSYYYGLVYLFENFYLCLTPYVNYKKEYACIRALLSKDGREWKILKDYFITKPTPRTNKRRESTRKNPIQPINGFYVNSNNDILFYFMDNYYNIYKDKPVTFKVYKINILNKSKSFKITTNSLDRKVIRKKQIENHI